MRKQTQKLKSWKDFSFLTGVKLARPKRMSLKWEMNLKIEFKMHTPNLGPYFKKKSNKLMAKVTPIIIMENLLENFNKMQVI